ncbi:MAG TPA: YCF48-related protein [Treponemataceae bacterium]|nr:YCF48-related protein [Treponemataceae bacterium]
MNTLTRLLSVCAVSAVLFSGCDTKALDWSIVTECEIPIGDRSHVAGFLNESYCVSVGYGGVIRISEDAGKTWTKAQNQSLCRFCLDIIDANLSWSGGNGSNVRVTKDGGKTWQAVTDCRLGSTHMSIDFLDDKTGRLASKNRIAMTEDGGATWKELSLPEGITEIATLAIRSANEGYVLTKAGILYSTTDCGANWGSASINLAKYKIAGDKLMAADMNFYGESKAEIVFSGNKKNGANVWILSTEDGGKTWNPRLLPYPVNSTATEIYFTSSGEYITVTSMNKQVKVFKKVSR